MSSAFAIGCGGQLVVSPTKLLDGTPVFYGVAPNIEPLYAQALSEGRPFYFIDNGYIGRAPPRRYEQGYFRVTKNAEQCEPWLGPFDEQRFNTLGIPIHEPRLNGRHILIATQTPYHYQRHGTTLSDWVESIRKRLPSGYVQKTRAKDSRKDLTEDLGVAWAVIVHTSMVGAEASLFGLPVFAMSNCALSAVASNNLDLIKEPPRPSVETRRQWISGLANNQWTLDEMRSGKCWADLQERYPQWRDTPEMPA